MNKNNITVVFLLLLITGLLVTIVFLLNTASVSQVNSDNDKDYKEAFQKRYGIFCPEIPDSLSFAGEPVPLNLFYVRENLDRELLVNMYWHSNTILGLKRSTRFLPIIEPILKEMGIPDDFKFLAIAESNLMNTVSPAGAAGFWQIMKSTATKMGLEVNDNVDERYHLEKATRVACLYLKQSYSRYQSWTMAAAAYNAGDGGVSKVSDNQSEKSYYQLWMNNETSRYVYRILAMKLIWENPRKYGFFIRRKDCYFPIPTKTLTVDSTITDLPAFAKSQNISYKTLREFNPWIRSRTLENKNKKKYDFFIPEPGWDDYNKQLLMLKNPDKILGTN